MNKRTINIFTISLIIILALTASSCDTIFQNHFFNGDENITDNKLPGTWESCPEHRSCSNEVQRLVLLITNNKNGTVNVIYRNKGPKNYKGNDRVADLHFTGKTYKMGNERFICLRIDATKNKEAKNPEDSYYQILRYDIEDRVLTAYFSRRTILRRLMRKKQLQGYREKKTMYGRSIIVTSSPEETRKVILEYGAQKIFRTELSSFYRL